METLYISSLLSLNRCMNISGASCVHSMRMIASSISLNAVGMGTTGKHSFRGFLFVFFVLFFSAAVLDKQNACVHDARRALGNTPFLTSLNPETQALSLTAVICSVQTIMWLIIWFGWVVKWYNWLMTDDRI